MLDTWDPSTAGFDSPKSATFALMFLSRRMLLLLRSLWIIVGEHPVWRYSIPDFFFRHFTFRKHGGQLFIFNVQEGIARHSRAQTFCSIFCNLKTLQPASYFFISSTWGTPPKYYTHLYIFSLWVQPSNTPCCCRGCSLIIKSQLRAKLEISDIQQNLVFH